MKEKRKRLVIITGIILGLVLIVGLEGRRMIINSKEANNNSQEALSTEISQIGSRPLNNDSDSRNDEKAKDEKKTWKKEENSTEAESSDKANYKGEEVTEESKIPTPTEEKGQTKDGSDEIAPKSVEEPAPEPVAEPVPEPIAEPVPEPVAEPVPEPAPEPEPTPEIPTVTTPQWVYYKSVCQSCVSPELKALVDGWMAEWTSGQVTDEEVAMRTSNYIIENGLDATFPSFWGANGTGNRRFLVDPAIGLPNPDDYIYSLNSNYVFYAVFTKGEQGELGRPVYYDWFFGF